MDNLTDKHIKKIRGFLKQYNIKLMVYKNKITRTYFSGTFIDNYNYNDKVKNRVLVLCLPYIDNLFYNKQAEFKKRGFNMHDKFIFTIQVVLHEFGHFKQYVKHTNEFINRLKYSKQVYKYNNRKILKNKNIEKSADKFARLNYKKFIKYLNK